MIPVNFGTCHLLGHSFGRGTANVSILMKFRTLHKVRVANSIVIISCSTCCLVGPVKVLQRVPQFSTKNGKSSNFDEILYFAQIEGGEFNGFDIERCKWVPQRIETRNRKTNLVSKILLFHYKQNW